MMQGEQTRINFSLRIRSAGKYVAVAAFGGLLIAAAPLIEKAAVSPAAIAAGTAETVLFTAAAPAAEIIPASVTCSETPASLVASPMWDNCMTMAPMAM